MAENPFEQSTLDTESNIGHSSLNGTDGSNFGSSGTAIDVRYPPASRVLVPGALAMSGVMVPIILFFVLQPPLNLLMAAITAILEFGTAAFMYFLFNSAFVRADDTGITKSQMGKVTGVRWEAIASMGMMQVGNGPMQIHFNDASGKQIFRCSTLGNRVDGEKLLDFIERKLQER